MSDCPYCGEMPDVDPDRATFACGTPRHHPQWGLRSFRCFRSQIDALVRQHEKLVAMLGKQQRIMMTFCGCCGGNPCRPDCELDALLKEETL